MSNELYRDFIDREADDIITSLGGSITPAVPNELYREFLDRKFTDVKNAVDDLILSLGIKSFTYVGTGTGFTPVISLPDDCRHILSVICNTINYSGYTYSRLDNILVADGVNYSRIAVFNDNWQGTTAITKIITNNRTIQFGSGLTAEYGCNANNQTYTVYYM